ncbi:Imm21 family immunity protein [Kitasatospora sp. KL5]|uniref:Imm21 family immunity protein n=1 Tax=Kitasatospora sp. KL5 TaxID=3425125 RepID=UPI003D6EC7EF
MASSPGPDSLSTSHRHHLEAPRSVNDPATPWEECGLWETDGPAILMDSAEAGKNLGMPYPDGSGEPDQAPVPLPAGRWRVRAFHKTGDSPWISVVQLLPQADGQSTTAP